MRCSNAAVVWKKDISLKKKKESPQNDSFFFSLFFLNGNPNGTVSKLARPTRTESGLTCFEFAPFLLR